MNKLTAIAVAALVLLAVLAARENARDRARIARIEQQAAQQGPQYVSPLRLPANFAPSFIWYPVGSAVGIGTQWGPHNGLKVEEMK